MGVEEHAVGVEHRAPAAGSELSHEAPVRAIVFRPDGRWLITTAGDCTTHVWEVGTWDQFACLQNETPAVEVVFSSDGRQFVTLGQRGEIELWSSDRSELPVGATAGWLGQFSAPATANG